MRDIFSILFCLVLCVCMLFYLSLCIAQYLRCHANRSLGLRVVYVQTHVVEVVDGLKVTLCLWKRIEILLTEVFANVVTIMTGCPVAANSVVYSVSYAKCVEM